MCGLGGIPKTSQLQALCILSTEAAWDRVSPKPQVWARRDIKGMEMNEFSRPRAQEEWVSETSVSSCMGWSREMTKQQSGQALSLPYPGFLSLGGLGEIVLNIVHCSGDD